LQDATSSKPDKVIAASSSTHLPADAKVRKNNFNAVLRFRKKLNVICTAIVIGPGGVNGTESVRKRREF